MIQIKNAHVGDDRDLLIFEAYIERIDCLLINLKLRVNKKTKQPYIAFPCKVEVREDGSKRFHSLIQFGGETGEALKKEILPLLKEQHPQLFAGFEL